MIIDTTELADEYDELAPSKTRAQKLLDEITSNLESTNLYKVVYAEVTETNHE